MSQAWGNPEWDGRCWIVTGIIEEPVTGDWLANIELPGQESVPVHYRHFDRRACRLALPLGAEAAR